MSNHIEKNIRAYDKKAADYNNTFDGKFTERFKTLLVANMVVNDNDSILDVGCGNGTLLSKIAKTRTINGFGIDISPNMIEHAKRLHPEFHFAVSGCEDVPFSDNSMDIITVCAAYHHFLDARVFASEARRVIKQGGSLYIAEIYLPLIIRHIVNVFVPLSKDGDVKFYSSKEIVDTFSITGFELVNTVKEGHIQIVHLRSL